LISGSLWHHSSQLQHLFHDHLKTILPEIMTEKIAQIYRTKYLKKIFNIQSWKRIFTLKTDFRLFLKVFAHSDYSHLKNNSIDSIKEKFPAFNHILFESFCDIADKEIPMLFVYGAYDKAVAYFEELFLKAFFYKNKKFNNSFPYEIVENSDHNFCLPDAHQRIIELILKWSNKYFS